MAERQAIINFGGQVAGGGTSGIGGTVSSGTGRGPASGLLDGLIANDKEQRTLEAQRIREQRAEIKARQKEALKTFTTATQINVEDNINRIANETPNNPQAIKTKGEGLIAGFIDALPILARPVFQAKARKSLNQKIAVANKKAIEITRIKAEIEAGELQAQLIGKLRDVAKNRFSENDDLRIASEDELEAVQAEMLAPFFEMGEDFEGNEFALFNDKTVDAQVDNIEAISLESGVEGWFDAQPNMAKAVMTIIDGSFRVPIQNGDKIVSRNVMDVLPDEGKGLLALLNTKMTARNRVNTENERKEEKDRINEQNLNLFDAYETIENPNSENVRITPGDIEDQVLAGALDPIKAIQLLKSVTEPPAIENDPLLFALLTSMIANNQDIETFVNDSEARLKPDVLWQLRKQNKTNQDRLAGKVQTIRNKLISQQRRILQRRIGINEGILAGAFEKLDPTLEDRASLAISEFDERITDPNLTNSEIRDIADELVDRTRLVQNSAATVFRKRLIKPRFLRTDKIRENIEERDITMAGDQLEKAFSNREIDAEEFLLEVKLINKWNAVFDEEGRKK